MGKNTPEYNKEYYEKKKSKILKDRFLRYRYDSSFREEVRGYNRDKYIPSKERYPINAGGGKIILNEDVMETPKGLYFSTRSLAVKLGCGTEFLREFIRKYKLNKKAVRYYCVNYYPEDLYDEIIDLMGDEGYRVMKK